MKEVPFVREYLRGFRATTVRRDYAIALAAIALGYLIGYLLYQLSAADSAVTFMLPGETFFVYTAGRQYFVGRRLTLGIRR